MIRCVTLSMCSVRPPAGLLQLGSRLRARLPGRGPVAVITGLCVFEADPITKELTVTSIDPGIDRVRSNAATGWPARYSLVAGTTEAPSIGELQTLRELSRRSAEVHGSA